MSSVALVLDEAALLALGTSPAGPIFRHVVAVGARVHTGAVQNLSGRMVNVRTGALRASGDVRTTVDGTVLRGAVVFNTRYALPVHEGTKPHQILPSRGTVLTWRGPSGDRVFARSVQHPGTKGRPFLRTSLLDVFRQL